jgi:uncharacterized protein (DUF2267 family)
MDKLSNESTQKLVEATTNMFRQLFEAEAAEKLYAQLAEDLADMPGKSREREYCLIKADQARRTIERLDEHIDIYINALKTMT